MLSKLKTYLPVTLFFSFIIWMIYLADTNKKNLIIKIGHQTPFGDKIGHFLLFGTFALLVNTAIKFKTIKLAGVNTHIGSLVVMTFAIAEEFSQLAFATRTFDLVDMLFDLLGVCLLSSKGFRKRMDQIGTVLKRLKQLTNKSYKY